MNTPRKPRLPPMAPMPPPDTPHPANRPDERKEGGPDYGKAEKQHENRRKAQEDAAKDEAGQ